MNNVHESVKALTEKWLDQNLIHPKRKVAKVKSQVLQKKNEEHEKQEKQQKQAINKAFKKNVDDVDNEDFILFIFHPTIERLAEMYQKKPTSIAYYVNLLNESLGSVKTHKLFKERVEGIQRSAMSKHLMKRCYDEADFKTSRSNYDDFIKMLLKWEMCKSVFLTDFFYIKIYTHPIFR